ncbi:MAG: alpha/beta hydrolase [Woeseiaceae bacterium]
MNKFAHHLTRFILFFFSLPLFAAETNYLQGLGDVHYHLSNSGDLDRGFHVYVMLPDGYEEYSTQYPTVYLLDGGNLFPMLTPYYRYLNFGGEMPEAIVVGISYGSDDFETGNFRSTDYTAPSIEREYWGGAAKFQSYLSDELLPFIEDAYRSDPNRRIIFGQSIGGQFAIYSALTKPNLFWGHIASNPAMHRNLPFFLELHGEADSSKIRSKLFIGSGSLDDPTFKEPADLWVKHWSGITNRPWELKVVNLEGHSHMSAPPASFRQGMRWLFATD